MNHLLSINDLNKEDIIEFISIAKTLKKNRRQENILRGKSAVLLFDKPSLRTKVSFEVAIAELGGSYSYLGDSSVGFGKRESLKDMAEVLSRYVHCSIIRTFKQKDLLRFAQFSSVPVVNALTDTEHPCQILSDLLTITERVGSLDNFKIAFIGDGNNVCNSLIQAAAALKFKLSIATPLGYEPKKKDYRVELEELNKDNLRVEILNSPQDAVRDADFIYTDAWTSMGWEEEQLDRKKVFESYQINKDLLKNSGKKCCVMHCLPAHRGEEITDDVIDSENSIVFDQAENRLHMHKAILIKILSKM
ncbi:MAG: ornithine carbamoyltransferase [Candidatus Kaelpia aquatica]|nr:ornithine carbamoyltransferase [Candidatus Kaelpia aquatica]